MFSKKITLGMALAAALTVSQAFADTGFKIPVHYNLELVDGIYNPSNYSRFNRFVTLTPGKHQIVVSFKDNFNTASDSRIVQSPNPVVVNIEDLKNDQVITFTYDLPQSESQAKSYARAQKVTITDIDGKAIPKEEASYFILTSSTGFTALRDYRAELLSVNQLYAPAYVAGTDRTIGMTDYGAPTIEADVSGGMMQQAQRRQIKTLSQAEGQAGSLTTSRKGGASAAGGVSYNQLVRLYESADDATKLKFVKYVMSH